MARLERLLPQLVEGGAADSSNISPRGPVSGAVDFPNNNCPISHGIQKDAHTQHQKHGSLDFWNLGTATGPMWANSAHQVSVVVGTLGLVDLTFILADDERTAVE